MGTVGKRAESERIRYEARIERAIERTSSRLRSVESGFWSFWRKIMRVFGILVFLVVYMPLFLCDGPFDGWMKLALAIECLAASILAALEAEAHCGLRDVLKLTDGLLSAVADKCGTGDDGSDGLAGGSWLFQDQTAKNYSGLEVALDLLFGTGVCLALAAGWDPAIVVLAPVLLASSSAGGLCWTVFEILTWSNGARQALAWLEADAGKAGAGGGTECMATTGAHPSEGDESAPLDTERKG